MYLGREFPHHTAVFGRFFLADLARFLLSARSLASRELSVRESLLWENMLLPGTRPARPLCRGKLGSSVSSVNSRRLTSSSNRVWTPSTDLDRASLGLACELCPLVGDIRNLAIDELVWAK